MWVLRFLIKKKSVYSKCCYATAPSAQYIVEFQEVLYTGFSPCSMSAVDYKYIDMNADTVRYMLDML